MKDLKAFRFTADGCMTMDTYYEQRRANVRDAKCNDANRHRYDAVYHYAEALGIEPWQARERIAEHNERLGR
jgi:hypothetical protein